jgi:hypothetical protein
MSYIRFTGSRMLPLSFFIPDVPRAGFVFRPPLLLDRRLGRSHLHSDRFPQTILFGSSLLGLPQPVSNSSAVSAPNSPCLRHRNRTVVAPAAISSSPWHSVHSNSTWTVFPSSLIFIANLISILITFRLIAGFIVQFTLYSPTKQ